MLDFGPTGTLWQHADDIEPDLRCPDPGLREPDRGEPSQPGHLVATDRLGRRAVSIPATRLDFAEDQCFRLATCKSVG